MKSIFILLVLLFSSCYGEMLLGGWRTSNDETLKKDCLKKALNSIHGAEVGDDAQTQVSDYVCRTQLVNGLNINCSFVLRGQNWECSYYKSFTGELDTKLDGCKPVVKVDKQGAEQPTVIKQEEDQQQAATVDKEENDDEAELDVARNPLPSSDAEEDDEASVDAINQQNREQQADDEMEEQ